jgi:LysR family transcriptional regulator, nod-box dependent transcriptional activator
MDVSARLRHADLNLLLPLDALLECRNVTRAAQQVGIGQSSMSAALARLRRLFGDPLLVRSGRVLELTPMGQALVEPVRNALLSLERMLAATPTFDPSTDTRSFTIVASDYVTLVLLRPLFEQVQRDAPGVALTAIPVGTATAAQLERAQADLVIMPKELSAYGMAAFPHRPLFSDRYVPTVWSQNRDIGDILDREAMERLPYAQLNAAGGGPSYVDIQLEALGIKPRVALSTLSFTLIPRLLPGTSLFGFVHERLLHFSPLRRELRILKTPVQLDPIVETMYWHPVFHSDPPHQWLRERITALAGNL